MKTKAYCVVCDRLVEDKCDYKGCLMKSHFNSVEYATYGDYLAAMDKVKNMKQETKMTREEAIAKYYSIMYTDETPKVFSMKWAKKTIEAIEALGLIKFDEDKKETIWIGDVNGCNNEHSMKMVEAALKASGYRIVKLGKITNMTVYTSNGVCVANGKLTAIQQEQS